MGKKKQRSTQTSNGEHCQKRSSVSKQQRIEWKSPGGGRDHAQLIAFKKGKNVVLTIPNPNTNETNKRFIKVPAKEVWRHAGR